MLQYCNPPNRQNTLAYLILFSEDSACTDRLSLVPSQVMGQLASS